MPGSKFEKMSAVSALALFTVPGLAAAQCVTDAQGDTNCTGTITMPQTIDNGTGIETVTVDANATIITTTNDESPLRVRGFTTDTVNNGLIRFNGADAFGSRSGIAAVLLESGVVPAGADTSNALISFTNNGTIETTVSSPLGSGGVYGISGVGDVQLVNGGNGSIDATTFGMTAVTLHSGGTASVVNNGTIDALQRGIRAEAHADGSTGIADNTGTINAGNDGVSVSMVDDTVGIGRNSGTINLTGQFAGGIDVGGFATGLDITAENTGTITSTGSDSFGIGALVIEDADISLQNGVGGVITMRGDNSYGIWADVVFSNIGTAGGTIDILNAGSINASGLGGRGINLFTDTSDSVSIVNDVAGTITASEFGIFADASGTDITVNNSGSVSADGSAVFVRALDGQAFLTNTGDIIDTSSGGSAVSIISDGGIQVENNGSITTAEDFSTGIFAIASDGALIFSSGPDGNISAQEVNSSLINLSTLNGDLSFSNAGDMMTVAGSSSIFLYAEGGDLGFDNSGTITAADSDAVQIEVDSGNATISNSGTVETGGAAAGLNLVTFSPGLVTITNTGIIASTGNAFEAELAGGSLILNNSGTIDGDMDVTNSTDTIINSGALLGDVFLNAGNDEMQISGADAELGGDINGGAGIDQLIFDTTSDFLLQTTISNVEEISVSGGSILLNDATIIGADSFLVGGDSTMSVDGVNSTIGAALFSNNGTVNIDAGTVLDIVNGDYVAASGSTTRFGLDTSNGRLTADGDITFATGSQIDINVLNQSTLVDGDTFDAAIAGGTLSDLSGDITDNSAMFDFTKQVIDGDTLRILIERALVLQDVVTAGDTNAGQLAGALQALVESGTADGDRLSTILGQLPDQASLTAALEGLKLDSSNGLQMSQIELANDLLSARDRYLRLSPGEGRVWVSALTGHSSLDAEAFTSGARNSRLTGIVGYDYGLANGRTLIGGAIALSAIDSDEDLDRTSGSEADATSLLGYVSSSFGNWNLHGDIGFSDYSVETQRDVILLGETARASFDTSSWFGQVEVNYAFSLTPNWTISPIGRLQYVSLDAPSYTESGSIVAASIDMEDVQSVRGEFGIGTDHILHKSGNALWSFGAYGLLGNEFGDIERHYTATIANAPAFTVQTGRADEFSVDVGGELRLVSEAGVMFSIGYDGAYHGNVSDQTARLRISKTF